MWPFYVALLLSALPGYHANELSRCCAGGGRHYREQKACTGLKAEGSSPTCSRTAAICCLRASLEKSCQLGQEMAVNYGYCSNTVNVLGGGLRKECCDCCLLAKELSINNENCEAPTGFSAACLSSFNKCCKSDASKNEVVPDPIPVSLGDQCASSSCEHFCSDKNGDGVECSCRPGFDLGPDGRSCIDIDECLIGADCLESQRCLNTPGSYKCIRTLTCGTGYALDSETDQCVDVDECNLGSHDCGALYHCRNTQGSYRCDAKTCGPSEIMNPKTGECTSVNCPSGYEVKNGSCADIDECKTLRRCGFYEECINLPGSYRCQEKGNLCASGFRMDKESGFCLDVDECSTGEHSCNDLQCINLPGSFKCRCSAGFEFNETTKLCEDVDECLKFKGHICSQHATCENTIGSFICHCNKGYQLAPDGRHCDDIDECETGQARCQQRCVNTPGSYQCVCNRGYQLGLDERTCEDIDECSTWARSGQELCMGSCINTPGSFKCTCPLGYALLDDNITCKDIDECASTGCPDPNSVCVNTLGGYRCQKIECPDKYVPDKHYKNMIDDGYSCLIDCNQTNVNCSADQTREILFQYRTIPSIQSLDKPLEVISKLTIMTMSDIKDYGIHAHSIRIRLCTPSPISP